MPRPPQTEWWSLIAGGRETPSMPRARVYLCFLLPRNIHWYGGKGQQENHGKFNLSKMQEE